MMIIFVCFRIGEVIDHYFFLTHLLLVFTHYIHNYFSHLIVVFLYIPTRDIHYYHAHFITMCFTHFHTYFRCDKYLTQIGHLDSILIEWKESHT